MRKIKKLLLVFFVLLGGAFNSVAQCYWSGCNSIPYQNIEVVNFPKSLTTGLTFDIQINVLPCYSGSYSGRAVIVKIGGAGGPNRNIDTVICNLTPGIITNISNISYPDSLLDEGVPYGDSTMFGFDIILLDNSSCPTESSHYLDASPPIISVKILTTGLIDSFEAIGSVYPTITSDKVIIDNSLNNCKGYLYSSSGVFIKNFSGESLSLSNHSNGMYFLVFINEKDKTVKKYKVIKF